MVRMILIWFILSVAIAFGVYAWHQLTGKDQWQLTKYVAYATMCSVLATMLLAFTVVLF